jgi:hypothetical protein
MLAHLRLLFSRALAGRVEITALKAGAAPRTRFFAVDDLEAAADWAAAANTAPQWNLYVGAATRAQDVFPGKAATDADVHQAWALFADADDAGQYASAEGAWEAAGAVPPLIVRTGTIPTVRAQAWWPLEDPLDDLDAIRAALRGVAATCGTDPMVCTGKQLMRLAGGIAWPKKPGRVAEMTQAVAGVPRRFDLARLARAFPPVTRGEIAAPTPPLEAGGLIRDGREAYAVRLVRARLREWIAAKGAAPSASGLYAAVLPVFLARTDQERPGRGPDFLRRKCVEAVRAYADGRLPGLGPARGTPPSPHGGGVAWIAPEDGGDPLNAPFRASTLAGDPPPRRWIVPDWIVEGAVNSLYGDGGLGKTLIAQQLACAVALGQPWLGLPTRKGAVLAVLCEDDRDELWRRQTAIRKAMGAGGAEALHDVWLWPRVGADNILVRWDRDDVPTLGAFAHDLAAAVARCGPSLLILDTLADVFGGNEIDRVQVNYFVKTVLGGLIQARAAQGHALTVLLLGHPSVGGKADGRGFSGSTAWNNAVRSRLYLTRPEDGPGDERILTRGKANYAASGDETAVRLYYGEGVLHAHPPGFGDPRLFAARREVVRRVEAAWRLNKAFTKVKKQPNNVYAALVPELVAAGFPRETATQAIRESLEDGAIVTSPDHARRGLRGA